MAGSHEFLLADPGERAHFPSRDAVLALPHELAAPQNRRRRVFRVVQQGRAWYLKEFGPTSWWNRVRFRTSLPHARDDAEREALVTLALRGEGLETPRPVLRGRDDLGSYYLCAEMPGRPLRDVLLRGPVPPGLTALCAAYCGDVLKKGYWLPDLSADHVFVRQEIAFLHFGLLDLHNGAVASPGPPPLRLCLRVLRHFARSLQDLPIRRYTALRFAARLLRNAGRGDETRGLVRRLPPLDTARRYEVAGKSTAYADRNPDRTARELDLLARVWPGRTGEVVLDVPSDAGRLLSFLRARQHRVVQIDGAMAMLVEGRERHRNAPPPPAAQAHALALPLLDRCVDGAVMFRFLHHLPRAAAKSAVAEACRVARRFVVVSFFHPCSAHHVRRRVADALRRRAPTRHALRLRDLERWFLAHGFALRTHAAELPYLRDLWLATFERR